MQTMLFVDDEPRVLQGLQRQLRTMRHEWDMHFVESGPKALEFLAGTPVQVIVTDMMMPGMDGAQLLAEVVSRYPDTVRLILSGHADREAVLRLVGPAHQYLSKPCNPDELRAAIQRSLSMRGLLSNDKLKQVVSRIPCLPSLPSLHAELTAELRSEDPSLEKVSEIISKDIGMATKVLQIANSAFFGLSQPAADVHEAVLYLGLSTIRALVLSVQVFSQFNPNAVRGFSIDALMHHCWRVSSFGRRIAHAEHCQPKLDDQCFLAGLLHDIGHLILAAGLPEEYSRVLSVATTDEAGFCDAERAEFGATHAEVGAYLLGLWGLPAPIVEAVALHHHPANATLHALSPVVIVHAADALASPCDASIPEKPSPQLDTPYLQSLGLAERVECWRELCLGEAQTA
ncbi:MAG TPA: response regulator [Verrucomicrobiae bacterium]|nr:response regulator [Verrucomicrobiae bacterium]